VKIILDAKIYVAFYSCVVIKIIILAAQTSLGITPKIFWWFIRNMFVIIVLIVL